MICGLCGTKTSPGSHVCDKCAAKLQKTPDASKSVRWKQEMNRKVTKRLIVAMTDTGHQALKTLAKRINSSVANTEAALKEMQRKGLVGRDKGFSKNMWILKSPKEESSVNASVSAILDGSSVVNQVERLLR